MLIGLIVVVVGLVLYLMTAYNGLVRLKVQCDNAWSDIDVQLKRRYDLIPNIVETVKGYAAHEKGTLEAVVSARNQAMSAQGPAAKGEAEGMLTGALRQLFALAEAYPAIAGRREFHATAEHAQSDRRHPAERAAVLQRRRSRLQHHDRAVSLQHRRRDGPLQGTRIFPAERPRRARSTEGQLRHHRRLAAHGISHSGHLTRLDPKSRAWLRSVFILLSCRSTGRRVHGCVFGARGGATAQNPEIHD